MRLGLGAQKKNRAIKRFRNRAISNRDFISISINRTALQESTPNLVAYGGGKIETKGLVTLSCILKGQSHSLQFFLVDQDVQRLLGFRACLDMGIVKMSPHVHLISTESSTKQILKEYRDLFTDELGEHPITYSMTVDSSVHSTGNAGLC